MGTNAQEYREGEDWETRMGKHIRRCRWGSAEGCGKYTLKEPRAKRFLSAHQSHQVPSTHAFSLLLPYLPSFLFLDPSSTCKLQDHPFPSIDFLLFCLSWPLQSNLSVSEINQTLWKDIMEKAESSSLTSHSLEIQTV